MDIERELDSLPVWLSIALFAAFFFFILSLLARISGWSELAEFYGGNDRLEGARKRFNSMEMGRGGLGMVSLSNVLTLTVAPHAIELSMFFPFNTASKPLLIPLADLSASAKKMLFFSAVELRAARAPSIVMRFPASVVRWIEDKSGARLLGEMPEASSTA